MSNESISIRSLGLEGAPNFRDLGGYRSAGGRKVRHGCLYRAESLAALSNNDLEVIRKRGIALIVDLRSGHEKQLHPNRLPVGHATESLSIDIDNDLQARDASLFNILKVNPTAEGARHVLLATYRRMPQNFGRHFPRLFERLADGDCPPAVFHCTLGKDRTGFAVAIILYALGVSLETIYADYLATAAFIDPVRLGTALAQVIQPHLDGPAGEGVIETILGVERDYLDAAIEMVESEYGSLERYLDVVVQLTDDKRERLQSRLLE